LLSAAQRGANHALALFKGEWIFNAAVLLVAAHHNHHSSGGAQGVFNESLVTKMKRLKSADKYRVIVLAVGF
jgi:hypothetical protein